jgi:coenzyme PQQ precursor peptide PqqA
VVNTPPPPLERPVGRNDMAWTTPRVVEVRVGMEVTSYESAE